MLSKLGHGIVNGDYGGSGVLPSELLLGEGFGASRTVLREVLRVLSEKGLVEACPRIGTRILPRAHWNLLDEQVLDWHLGSGNVRLLARDLVEARSAIEPEAAAKAAERRSVQELRWLSDTFDEMVQKVDEVELFVRADMRFHEGILEASGNELFKRMAHAIRAALVASRQITVKRPGSSKKALALHEDVLNAISAQQSERARLAMRKLVVASAADINAVLNARKAKTGLAG